MQLGLGTAQFGSAYGITNSNGQISADDALHILQTAENSGVHVLDTAAAYGDAEEALGRALWRGHAFRVITKTLPIGSPSLTRDEVSRTGDAFKRSLDRLRLDRVAGLLLHHGDEILRPGGGLLADMLLGLKDAGLVERIGISCYTPEELRAASRILPPDLVQVPVNILDRRFLSDGILGELKREGTEIHARSAFLQGLLLTPGHALPASFEHHRSAFSKIDAYATSHDLTRLELALGFLASLPEIDVALVGVTCVPELEEIVAAWRAMLDITLDFEDLGYDDESLLLPSRWRKAVSQEAGK